MFILRSKNKEKNKAFWCRWCWWGEQVDVKQHKRCAMLSITAQSNDDDNLLHQEISVCTF